MNKTSTRRTAIIMAGGSGERFWPLSRRLKPKQLLRLGSETYTLLEQTVLNISPLIPREQIFFATGRSIEESIRNSRTGIQPENILVEPYKRNTAGCLVFAAANLLARYGGDGTDITMAILPADHIIGNPETFRTIADAAMTAAERESALVTLGVKPARPETGYGYLELESTPLPDKNPSSHVPVYPVIRFCEKPGSKTAEDYIESGRFFWNSGMFFWRLSTFIGELGKAAPEMAEALKSMAEYLKNDDSESAGEIFKGLENISIDYALMEKAKRVLAVRADFGWDDVGAWDALERTFPGDKKGNITVGEPVVIDSKNCIVYNEPGAEDMAVAVVGVEGLAVIVTGDGVLVVPKDSAQNVRKVVEELKKRNAKQL